MFWRHLFPHRIQHYYLIIPHTDIYYKQFSILDTITYQILLSLQKAKRKYANNYLKVCQNCQNVPLRWQEWRQHYLKADAEYHRTEQITTSQ